MYNDAFPAYDDYINYQIGKELYLAENQSSDN